MGSILAAGLRRDTGGLPDNAPLMVCAWQQRNVRYTKQLSLSTILPSTSEGDSLFF
jgi:hypothetical protein